LITLSVAWHTAAYLLKINQLGTSSMPLIKGMLGALNTTHLITVLTRIFPHVIFNAKSTAISVGAALVLARYAKGS
jgi:hypothetical protein